MRISRRKAASLLASAAIARGAEFAYRAALPGYVYQFPRDHFSHPDFRTEWWYYTGNVRAAGGQRFGFELVFFRQAQRRGETENKSVWRVDDLYLAHLALSDIDGKRFVSHKRLNRAGPGIAGVSFEKRRIWNGNWSSVWDSERQTLEATAEEFRFRLRLTPSKPFVIHGEKGVSQKAGGEGKASHYVSFSRLQVEGELETAGVRHAVTGRAWMDHEWFTHQLETSQAGWDWFSVQLDDGRDLMLFQLRRTDGSIDPYSAGTLIEASGKARHLNRDQFVLEPGRKWTSPRTATKYPVAWRVLVPSAELDLTCEAALDGQELVSDEKGSPNYWEGAVRYGGSASGVGYLEMTGYDRPVSGVL
jgi:predicted secreted hydrolase